MISEADLESLEAYLDDALSTEEVQQLDNRLSSEPELASGLQALRAERAVRSAVWESLTDKEADTDTLADRIVVAVRRRRRFQLMARWMRGAGALAACVLFGFTIGWVGRGRAQAIPQDRLTVQPASDTYTTARAPKPSDTASVYEVALTDESGNVIAVQKFSKVEDARQFANDWSKMEARKRQAQQGRAVLVQDRF